MIYDNVRCEQRWENQPAVGWTVDDLDLGEVRNTVAEAVRLGRLNEPERREPEDLLRVLGLLRDGILPKQLPYCLVIKNGLCSKCHNVCSGLLGSRDLIVQSFWIIGNLPGMRFHFLGRP